MSDQTTKDASPQATTTPDLPTLFFQANSRAIDDAGITIPQAIGLRNDGNLTVFALALAGADAVAQMYRLMFRALNEQSPVELIFGWDRFTKTGQGTTLDDFLSVHYFRREVGWRFGIMEYRHEPRLVLPIAWEHEFWSPHIRLETFSHFQTLGREARNSAFDQFRRELARS